MAGGVVVQEFALCAAVGGGGSGPRLRQGVQYRVSVLVVGGRFIALRLGLGSGGVGYGS